MNKACILKIELYLKAKKLSDTLFNEVRDHFISQIDYLMDQKNMDFESAFFETKFMWQKDLEMVKSDYFSFKKVARIEKNLIQDKFSLIIRNSIITAIFASVFCAFFPAFSLYLLFGGFAISVVVFMYVIMRFRVSFHQVLLLNYHPLMLRLFIFNIIVWAIFGLPFNFLEMEISRSKFRFQDFTVFLGLSVQLQLLYFQLKKNKVIF